MFLKFKLQEEQLLKVVRECSASLDNKTFFIGGFIRDKILQRETNDIDLVSDHSALTLAQCASDKLDAGKVVVYKKFGTAMFDWKGLNIEFVNARKESYRYDSRKPEVLRGTLQDDQLRRDFTINALAVSVEDPREIIDPFNGLKDLKDKVIRTPLDPHRTFSDDPLRMLRAVRFATELNFDIAPETLKAISSEKERFEIISPERIHTELNRILLAPTPSIGFYLMEETGLLQKILPELSALKGVEIKEGIGHKENFSHTLEVLDNLVEAHPESDLWLRWATLLHDIGKPASKRFDSEQGWTFHGHEVIGERMVKGVFRRLRLPLDHQMRYVKKLVRLHQRPVNLTREEITDSALRRLLYEAGEDLDDLMKLCRADITSKNPRRRTRYKKNYTLLIKCLEEVEERDRLRNWQPPVDGRDIMKSLDLAPGPMVGKIKESIREAILNGEIPNNEEAARKYMFKRAKQLGLS